ncbi:hypothetical protein ATANTOWER_028874, partial [Ataeniobius toweri]|nr:hypothetical protein [Ataeniobius toweri]
MQVTDLPRGNRSGTLCIRRCLQPHLDPQAVQPNQLAVKSSSIMLQTATPVKYPTGYSTPGTLAKRPKLTLSSFDRSRFGGRHVESAKPNINVARKTHTNATCACTSTAAHSCADPVPAGGSLHNISPPQPQSAETFFLAPPLPAPKRQRPVEEQSSRSPFQPENTAGLPLLWPKTMPEEDHQWVSTVLFRVCAKGKLELQDHLQLWYFPPQPSLIYHQAPTSARFFAHPLLLWMPYRLWKVQLLCADQACKHPLSSGGLHRRVRQVLDIDRFYNLVTETLICSKCRQSYLSWNREILEQLDMAHRSEFRVILSRR